MTQIDLVDREAADSGRSRPSVRQRIKGYLSKPYTAYSSYQKAQIQKARLRFLTNCRYRKRPPPSLRINGASSLEMSEKIKSFSALESELLNTAIVNKQEIIKRLSADVKSNNLPKDPLPQKDCKAMRDHFAKKQYFYRRQDSTKWKDWPQKFAPKQQPSNRKRTNFKKRAARNRRKLEKTAKRLIEEGSIVVLINEEIPDEAISVLGKGLGFVPTPAVNIEDIRLDMRLTTSRILTHAKSSVDRGLLLPTDPRPSKLHKKYYGPKSPSPDPSVNEITDTMSHDLDSRLRRKKDLKPRLSNLSKEELKGLKWLEEKTRENEICVIEADKGGAILIVYPELLRKKTLEKLKNPSLYTQLPEDPTPTLHKHLFDVWVNGKTEGLVSARHAKEVMGVSDNMKADGSGPTNRPSTLPHYKPGMSYFYPSMKIHKLQKNQIIPGVEPPIRLITALHDGISKRSDVFIAESYLGALEKDFCGDLLTDSTDALRWLDAMDETLSSEVKSNLSCFTFDFKALYDSLNKNLVIEAFQEAANECRPDWSPGFVSWLVKLVELSLESSVGVFEDKWYKQKEGIPTGGSLCVQLANITVFSILRKTLYSKPELMSSVISVKRYIDDGAGLMEGSAEDFANWIAKVNQNLAPFGLHIDESNICPTNTFVPFLDIQFCFDDSGSLQTDLYVKPTDSRAYLNLGSAHPKHTFSGIVYSGCFRLRRIINNQERLEHRLQELKLCVLKTLGTLIP